MYQLQKQSLTQEEDKICGLKKKRFKYKLIKLLHNYCCLHLYDINMESIKDSKLGKSLWRIKEYSLFKFFLITVSPSFILVIQNWRSLPYPSLSYDEVFWVSTSLKTSPELYSVYKLFGQNLFLTNYAGSTKGIFYSIILYYLYEIILFI